MPSLLRKRTHSQRYASTNRLFKRSPIRKRKVYKRTYRKTYRKSSRAGLMKYKKSLRRPMIGTEYNSVQFKNTARIEVSPAQSQGIMPELKYGYQFRRFGVHTGGASIPNHNTLSVFDCPGWITATQEWREFAIMGMKIQFQPLLFQNELQPGQSQTKRNPIVVVNNTWFDTIQEAVNGIDAATYGPAQKYKPGTTVNQEQMMQRPTLQRHRPTGGWTKNVVNNLYARQQNLEWFKCSDFYQISSLTGAYSPVCPASCPNPVLRHYLKFDEPFDPAQMWGPGTVIGNYQITYTVKFRGKIPKV